jgi:hypothetical protein
MFHISFKFHRLLLLKFVGLLLYLCISLGTITIYQVMSSSNGTRRQHSMTSYNVSRGTTRPITNQDGFGIVTLAYGSRVCDKPMRGHPDNRNGVRTSWTIPGSTREYKNYMLAFCDDELQIKAHINMPCPCLSGNLRKCTRISIQVF